MDAKILIVDDSPEMIDILRDILPKNMKGQVALNGPSALKILEESEELPDLILLDVMMPEMNGFDVCRRIKRNNRLKEIPIIFISSLSKNFDKVLAFRMGAVDYITKPFEREEVLARIDTHLEIYNSRKLINKLYSETIQGTIEAMNDMMALANPEVSHLSNTLKSYSEKIMEELSMPEVWDLKLACVFSGLGMLSEDIRKAGAKENNNQLEVNLDSEIKRTYSSLSLSNDIIQRIPRFEAITSIIEKASQPLERKYRGISPEEMESEVLKGQILRILIYYLLNFERDKNYENIIEDMKKSKKEYYCPEILTALLAVQQEITSNEIIKVDIGKLKTGMVLMEDLYCPDGRLLLKAGYELSLEMILLINNFERLEDVEVEVLYY